MEISSGDLTNIRSGNSRASYHLNIMPKVVIGTALVNQGIFTYPLGSITVDTVSLNGGLADLSEVPVNSMVYIGTSAGDNDILTTVVRKQSTATILHIVGKSLGDTGQPVSVAASLADDQFITIFAQQPIWPIISLLRSSILYKNFDVSYTNQNNNPQPVCNIGTWERHPCDVGGTVDVVFAEGDSEYWPGYANNGYQWSQRNGDYETTGATVTGGGETTSTVTYQFDPGFYIVSLEITSDNGSAHIATKYVWIVDGSVETDFEGWEIKKDSQDIFGRKMTIDFSGTFSTDDLMPHTPVMFSEVPTFNDETVTTGAVVTQFCGFLEDYRTTRAVPVLNTTNFQVSGPGVLLKDIPAAAQYMRYSASPASWIDLEPGMVDTNGRAWYILNYHCPAVLALFDFETLASDTLVRRVTTANGAIIAAQLEEIANLRVTIGWLSDGTLVIKRVEPLLGTSTERDAVDEKMTWEAQDIREQLQINTTTRLKTGKLDAYGFDFTAPSTIDAYWSRSPGDIQAPGKDRIVFNGLTITGQADLQQLSGNMYARNNQEIEQVTITVIGNIDTAEPALNEWHRLQTAATLNPMTRAFDDRMTPVKITRTWRKNTGGAYVKEIKTTFEIETQGLLGINKAIPVSPNASYLPLGEWGLNDYLGYGFQDGLIPAAATPPALATGENKIVGVNDDSYLYRTPDFTTVSGSGGPTWDQVASGVSGTPLSFVVDAFSPAYVGSGTSVDGWIVTDTGIYKMTDLLGVAPSASLQMSWSATINDANIDFSFGSQGWGVCVAHHPTNGVVAVRTIDSGITWSAEVAITGLAYYLAFGNISSPALYVSSKTPGLTYAIAWRTTGYQNASQGEIYKSTDYGITWALATDLYSDPGACLGHDLHFPWNDNSDESICYYTYGNWSFGQLGFRLRSIQGLTPFGYYTGGGNINTRWGIQSSPADRQYMLAGTRNKPTVAGVISKSTDGGTTWSTLTAVYGAPRIAMAGDNKLVFYLFGSGVMAYSNDFGVIIDSRYGNLGTFSPGEFIGIAGGG